MKRSYHHGSLRDALVKAAIEAVREQGIEALSLRELARRAGVSAGAPYRHFGDRNELVAAIVTDGFRRFDDALASCAQRNANVSALTRVQQLGVAYVTFAATEPKLFRAMFGQAAPAPGRHADLDDMRRRAGAHLPRALAELHAEGVATDIPVPQLVELAWAVVHGLAFLHLDHLVGTRSAEDANALAERVTQRLTTLLS